jgi:hypothetical protein
MTEHATRIECGTCHGTSRSMWRSSCECRFVCTQCIRTCMDCGCEFCNLHADECAQDDAEWHCRKCCRATDWNCALTGKAGYGVVYKVCTECDDCYCIDHRELDKPGMFLLQLCNGCAFYRVCCQELVQANMDEKATPFHVLDKGEYYKVELCPACLPIVRHMMISNLSVPNVLVDEILSFLTPELTYDPIYSHSVCWSLLDDLNSFIPWRHGLEGSGSYSYLKVVDYVVKQYSPDLMCSELYNRLIACVTHLHPTYFQDDQTMSTASSSCSCQHACTLDVLSSRGGVYVRKGRRMSLLSM